MKNKEEIIRKIRKKEKEIKEELLNMNEKEIEFNTKYIIYFEDWGQDFLEWHINKEGNVIDSKPFQRNIWVGKFTIPETAKVGEKLAIWLDGESYVNYPIRDIKILKNGEKLK